MTHIVRLAKYNPEYFSLFFNELILRRKADDVIEEGGKLFDCEIVH